MKPPGMLLFSIGSKRLITYVYPLLLWDDICVCKPLSDYQKITDQ